MAIALIGSVSAGANNSTSVTTAGVDLTGANLIVIGLTMDAGGGSPTPTDSLSNTWTGLTQYTTTGARVRFFYCVNPVVGSGQTFTLSQSNSFPALVVTGWSGIDTSPFDVENGNPGSFNTSLQTGSITPNVNGELILALIATDAAPAGGTYVIDSSFNAAFQVGFVNGQHYGSGVAYLVQATAGAVNPEWSNWSPTDCCAAIASFKAAVVIRTGDLSQTLSPVTLSAAGVAPVAGDLAKTLGAVTVSSAGSLPGHGVLTQTLADITLAATGGIPLSGTLSITLGPVAVSANGSVSISGTLTKTLGLVALVGDGYQSLRGDLSVTLSPTTLSAGGKLTATGSLIKTLTSVVLSASGGQLVGGSLIESLFDVTVSASGILSADDIGFLHVTLQNVTLAASGTKKFPKPPNNLVQGPTKGDFWQTHDFPEIL